MLHVSNGNSHHFADYLQCSLVVHHPTRILLLLVVFLLYFPPIVVDLQDHMYCLLVSDGCVVHFADCLQGFVDPPSRQEM
ncbi:hypothetical protein MTR67_001961 [Solanum verrucosum]|uniref:Uncharacterized protein n=1 Tax=Solanum verrucosum TaxID=315347 RepID=A0AAF0PTS6_SOLVR|nr:hypothetical protein MTR67_001961 [Solanum verrucosum]